MTDGGFETESILQTKIVQPPVRSVVRRERLFERLDRGATCKLTLVSAPAGYGKSTLVSTWLAERSRDCCWLNLDRLDGSAHRVTVYLEAALDRLQPRKDLPGANRLVAFLNALAARRDPTMVVLDDYHLAESAEVNDLVALVLENLPPIAHFVIITRSDPTLRLAKLRGQGEVVEIRQSDLAFTIEESNAFLAEVGGVVLNPEQVKLLSYSTEGWIAGLQMLASSLKDGVDPSHLIGELGGGQRYLRDYLVEEVLTNVDLPTREFLERCSILERLSADVCDALTGRSDSIEVLSSVDRQNLFVIPLDEEHRWFRLHHLFAEVLLARLRDHHAEELPALHRKASEWFDAHHQPFEAISHLVDSGDTLAAAELISAHAEWLMKRGELMAVKAWIASIPEEVCARYPVIVLLRAWAGIVDARPLAQIERELDMVGGTGAYEAEVLCLRSYLAGLQGKDEEALQLSERAARMVSGQDLFVSGDVKFRIAVARLASGHVTEAISLLASAADESLQAGNLPVVVAALAHKARAMVEQGELDGGEQTYQRALDLGLHREGRRGSYVGSALIGLGEISRLRGNIESSVELFREGMEISGDWLDLNAFYTSLGSAFALLAQGRQVDAWKALQSADQLAQRFTIPLYFTRLVEAHRIIVALRCGRLQEARARVPRSTPPGKVKADSSYVEALVSDLEILGRALLALLDRDPRRCIDLAGGVERRASRQGQGMHALQADLLLAQAHWQAEEIDDALSVLERALSFAAERRIVQPFVDEGPEFAGILYRARTLGVNHPFIGKLLAAFPPDQQSTAAAETQPHSIEPLSAREVRVLTLLSQGMSNKEVAAELYLSVRTVKWYTSSIYGKLDVSSRTQAIARARQLRILPE